MVESEGARSKKKQVGIALVCVLILAACFAIVRLVPDEVVRMLGTVLWALVAASVAAVLVATFVLRGRKRGVRIGITAVSALVGAVAGFSVAVYVLAPTMMFYPHFDEESFADLREDPAAEEVSLDTERGRVSGWFFHNAPDDAPLVLYFYGNGQDAASLLQGFKEYGRLEAFEGYNIAAFDYPGYGKTEGEPSEASLKAFGLAVYDALAAREDVDPARITPFGYSIGTGVATYVAAERNVDALVLMAPYADGYDLYNNMADVFYGPLRALVAFRMESVALAPGIEAPALVLSSRDDEMVPFSSSERLAVALANGRLAVFEGFGHNDYWASEDVRAALTDFLAEQRG